MKMNSIFLYMCKDKATVSLISLFIILIILILGYNSFSKVAIFDEIEYDAKGLDGSYNIINIIFYVFIAIFMLIIIHDLFKSWDVKINNSFIIFMIPFILFGSFLRVVEDFGYISYPFSIIAVSPVIYILIAFIIVPTVFILQDTDFINKFDIRIGKDELNFSYILLLLSHIFDSIITIIGIEFYKYDEKNVTSSLFLDLNPILFFIYKVFFVLIFIGVFKYNLRVTSGKSKEFKTLILLSLIALGLAPAIRNSFRVFFGV